VNRMLWLLTFLGACSPQGLPVSKTWSIKDFAAKSNQHIDFGGFYSDALAVGPGQLIPFQTRTQSADGVGLVIRPAFVKTESAAFVITDLWFNHPNPWVQPVYSVLPNDDKSLSAIFPVDVDSTFYSPFWKRVFIEDAAANSGTYRSSSDVLSSKRPTRSGGLVFCPISPGAVGFAGGPAHPFSGLAVAAAKFGLAYVDGKDSQVKYLDVKGERYRANGQNLVESNAYFFVVGPRCPELPVPAILPNNAFEAGFLRRVNVTLPRSAVLAVPLAQQDQAKQLLENYNLGAEPECQLSSERLKAASVPSTSFFKVASNATCFNANDGGCVWLDSASAVESLSSESRVPSSTTLAVDVVLVGSRLE
jgi:hypothetical protein